MYKVKEVVSKKDEKSFIDIPKKIYSKNKFWIKPIDSDIKKVFDKAKNPCFQDGEAIRWILLDEADNTVGRIAAFINYKISDLDDYRVGQMGFFECIDDIDAAYTLFDKAKEWLESKGMEAMEGPVNFGERLEWWGLLVDGYDKYPNYNMPYNQEYYENFFTKYGFRDYFKQYTFRCRVSEDTLSPIISWKADRMLKDSDYKAFTYRQIGMQKSIDALIEVYNKSWNLTTHGVEHIDREEVKALYKKLSPIIDKDLIYFAFYGDKPIGFFVMFPELNQAIRHMNGKMNMWSLLKMMYVRHIKKIDIALGILFGVVPEFQSKGVEAIMIKTFATNMGGDGSSYEYLEMNWIGDFNPAMIHLMKHLNATAVKTHITYRKVFDNKIKFVRQLDK